MKKVKIGYLPLYVKLYDDNVPFLRPRIEGFSNEIVGMLSARADVEVVAADICRLENEFQAAVELFEKEEVDAIVTLHLAYSPSLQCVKPLVSTKLPIVVLDTTPNFAFTDDNDADALSYCHGIHGVQDMCNLLVRNDKMFFVEAGHYLESDVIERVVKRVKGIKIADSFRHAKVGTIGGEFAGMGDFQVADSVYDEIGIERVPMKSAEAKQYVAAVRDEEIDALLADDAVKYDVDPTIEEAFHRNSLRGDLAVRAWIEQNKLTAFTANFMTIDAAFGLCGMPFAEANRAMTRGIGYAGEGDVLTAALVGALMDVSDEATFIEMFCPDWAKDLIYISHMGEMNVALSGDRVKYLKMPMLYSDIDTTWLCGSYKEGTATLLDLVPLADRKFRVVTSLVEMKLPACDKQRGSATSGWFAPESGVADFLEDYSHLGGTHHLTMMYGDMRKSAEAFAAMMDYEYFEI